MPFTTATESRTRSDGAHPNFVVPSSTMPGSSTACKIDNAAEGSDSKLKARLAGVLRPSKYYHATTYSDAVDLWRYPLESSRKIVKDSAGVWHHQANIDGKVFLGSPEGRTDLPTCFEWMAQTSGQYHADCTGHRSVADASGSYGPLLWESRATFISTYRKLARGLLERPEMCPKQSFDDIGFRHRDGSFQQTKQFRGLGVLLRNAPSFTQLEFACQLAGITLIPLYPTLGVEALGHILEETQLETIAVDPITLKTLIEWIDSSEGSDNKISIGRVLLCIDKNFSKHSRRCYEVEDSLKACERLGIDVVTFRDLIGTEEISTSDQHVWSNTDIWTICYTSGTTGRPKGVMLTQGNLMHTTHDVLMNLCTDRGLGGLNEHRSYFSYLPMAHIFERIVIISGLLQGFRVAFHTGDLSALFDEIKSAKTTLLCAVPRVLERLRSKIIEAVEAKGPFAKSVFDKFISSKVDNRKKNGSLNQFLPDLMMNSIKSKVVGPHLSAIVAGGAPLSTTVREEVQAILSCVIVNGYGLTESTGPAFVQHSSEVSNCVGGLFRSGRCTLMDVPSLGYSTADNKGELLLDGYNIFAGYFRQQDQTEDVFHDGYFKTGDVAHIDESLGVGFIVDRVKNCFKLAQGEYIAPEKIENVLKIASAIEQVVIIGTSTESHCVAAISLSDSFIHSHAPRSQEELVVDPEVHAQILRSVQEAGKSAGLNSFEIPKAFILLSRSLLVEDGFHTPTLKLKRPVFSKAFGNFIDRIYEEGTTFAVHVDRLLRGDLVNAIMLS